MKSLKNIIKKIDTYSPLPLFYTFHMTKVEKKLFDKTIKKSKVYVEFGIGGSTLRVLNKSKAEVYSIESDITWIRLMKQYRLIKKMENKRFFLHHVDIGKTTAWGKPFGDNSKENYPAYSALVFEKTDPYKIDTVLVDGRFRVACTLKTIIVSKNKDNLLIIIHDFWNRPKYHILLKFLEQIEMAETLGIFRVKKDIDLNEIEKLYDIYKYNPE